MKKQLRIVNIVRIINASSKLYIPITIFLKLFALSESYVILYINKLVLNRLSEVIISYNDDVFSIVRLLLVSASVEIGCILFYNIFQFLLGKIRLKYEDEMVIKICSSINNLDLSYYDDTESYNETKQIGRYKVSIIEGYTNVLNIAFYMFSFLIATVVMIRFSVLIMLFAIISAVPGMIIKRKIKIRQYQIERKQTQDTRFVEYLSALFYRKNVEMEMQTYGFHEYIINKLKINQEKVRNEKINNSTRKARDEGILIVLNKFFQIIKQIGVLLVVLTYKMSIGDFTYYVGITSNLTTATNNIFEAINNLHVSNTKYDEFQRIISRKPRLEKFGEEVIEFKDVKSIEFRNVSFRYPNSEQFALSDVSFRINKGDKIALVGVNGSGKTTIIKLLMRFYDPTDGEILLNEVNIKYYDLNSYRRIFSTMFQEQTSYLLSIKENVILSNVNMDGDVAVNKAEILLNKLKLGKINEEKIDMERTYGREFSDNGYIFSKGQQQRLQAARTLFCDAAFYLLDEPSASMDAISEEDFLNTLESYTEDRTVVYITHRYHNLHLLDRIIVIDNGKIVEMGDHFELIKNKGLYANMYNLQADKCEEEMK